MGKSIACTTDSLNHGASLAKGFAQPLDMDIHRSFFDENMITPYFVEQLCSGMNALSMMHEKIKQLEFRGS
jgi:hypothetical protein